MQQRILLRDQLSKAWKATIHDQYNKHLINSERGLQVYFCSALLKIFKEDELTDGMRRIFVEPRLSVGPEDYRYPDIVICNTRRIIGVVELKYLPRGSADYDKDIDTLNWLVENSEKLKISNDRFLGISQGAKKYSLAEDAVLCWGGVYQCMESSDFNARISVLGRRFLGLHAVTAKDKEPIISPP